MTMKLSRLLLSTVLVIVAFAGVFLVPPAPVSAANWYVDPLGTDAGGFGTGPGLAAFKTIQYAHNAAGVLGGDTIYVAAGIYSTQQITITKAINLIGASSATTIIRAPVAGRVAITTDVGSICDYVIAASFTGPAFSHARIENFSIDANSTGIVALGATMFAGVLFNNTGGATAGLYNSEIYGFAAGAAGTAYDGVAVFGNSPLTISGCDISQYRRNGIRSMGDSGALADPNITVRYNFIGGNITSAAGIYLGGGGSATIGGSAAIDGNELFQTMGGIDFLGVNTILIQNNEIHGTAGGTSGINCGTATATVNILDNIIYDLGAAPGDDGILVWGASVNCNIYDNDIHGCFGGVRVATGTGAVNIMRNYIYQNSFGIFTNTNLNNVTSNFIAYNNTGIYVNSTGLVAHCNGILKNVTDGVALAVTGTGPYDLENNYWGANSGPKLNGAGPGTGDNINTGTASGWDFNPWIVFTLTANPVNLLANGTSSTILTADTRRNSGGAIVGCFIPGEQVRFTAPYAGFGGATTALATLTGGVAYATLTSRTTPGTVAITVTIVRAPTIIETTNVTFDPVPPTPTPPAPAPAPTPVNPLLGTGASISHGSSVIAPTTPAAALLLPGILTQSASLSAKTVTPGTPVMVTANLVNKGAVNGTKRVTLYVNGQVETTQGVNVNSGSSAKLTFDVSRSEPGDYTVYVDGVPAGSFKVEMVSGNDAILIFSAVLVGLAFIIGMVMLRRRQRTM